MFNKPASTLGGFFPGKRVHTDGFVEQKLMLSSNFRCDQICDSQRHDFWSHSAVLLKSDLDVQLTYLCPHLQILGTAEKVCQGQTL
jgi:hypothetical protein